LKTVSGYLKNCRRLILLIQSINTFPVFAMSRSKINERMAKVFESMKRAQTEHDASSASEMKRRAALEAASIDRPFLEPAAGSFPLRLHV
jgi:hypothetical protein